MSQPPAGCFSAAASSAVVYYKPPERIRLHNFTVSSKDYNIDLNGDGIFEVQHDSVGGSAFLRTWGDTRILGVDLPLEHATWSDSYPYAMVAGMSIGPDSPELYPQYGTLSGWQAEPLGSPGAASLHVRYDSGTSGFFVGARGFIGIEFPIDGETHYGWIDLDNYTWWQSEIHGWAYESEPGKPILAGSIPEPSTLLLTFATLGLCLFIRRRDDGDR